MTIEELLPDVDKISLRFNDDHSSIISFVGFDKTSETVGDLLIEFRNTQCVYKYKKVPTYIFCELLNHDSIGKYFTRVVKTNFEYEKVNYE